jgi:hypothetical protein
MDNMYRAIENGEMTVEQMLDRVSTLDQEFAKELQDKTEEKHAGRKAEEDESLELQMDDYLPAPAVSLKNSPETSLGKTISQSRRKTRSLLHIRNPGSLPVRWAPHERTFV